MFFEPKPKSIAKVRSPRSRLATYIRGRIEEAVDSLGFSHVQRDVFEAEFLWPAPSTNNETSLEEMMNRKSCPRGVLKAKPGQISPKYRRTVSGLGKIDFAISLGIDPKTYWSLLKTKKAAPETWLAVANGMGLKLDELLKD